MKSAANPSRRQILKFAGAAGVLAIAGTPRVALAEDNETGTPCMRRMRDSPGLGWSR
jgi:hypothetical protein